MSSGTSYGNAAMAAVDDDHDEYQYQTWRTVAARRADHRLIKDLEDDDVPEEYDFGRKIHLNNMNHMPVTFKFLDTKTSQQPRQQQMMMMMMSSGDNNNSKYWHNKTCLPEAETLPRNEVLGGYIFVCNNETMQEDLRRQLFGLPQKYKDSVRAITPGLPLFLYNYTAHQLHGVFQAVSFGGSNIDPTAWEDKKCKGESRFPAQVRIRVKERSKPLEEDAFRPILYHYDGPKFRLQLSVPEALALLDLFKEHSYVYPQQMKPTYC